MTHNNASPIGSPREPLWSAEEQAEFEAFLLEQGDTDPGATEWLNAALREVDPPAPAELTLTRQRNAILAALAEERQREARRWSWLRPDVWLKKAFPARRALAAAGLAATLALALGLGYDTARHQALRTELALGEAYLRLHPLELDAELDQLLSADTDTNSSPAEDELFAEWSDG